MSLAAVLCLIFPTIPATADELPFITSWGSYGSADGQIQDALNLSVSTDGAVYVADMSNQRVDQFDSSGQFVRKWDVSGPWGIAVAPNGSVYVCTDYSILQFSPDGAPVRTWGSQGGGPGQFLHIQDIAVDGEGSVYAADYVNHRIQRFDPTGVFLNQWTLQGGSGSGFPKGISAGPDGYVYVADSGNSTIQKYTSTGTFITAWMLPYATPGEGNRVGRPAITSDGLVYVPDKFGNKIAVFTTAGAFVEAWGVSGTGPGQFNTPTCAALGENASLYVMDFWNHRIQKFGQPVTGIEESDVHPQNVTVSPNPSRGPLRIRLTLSRTSPTEVLICDVRGRLIRRLWVGTSVVGAQTVSWDGRDERNGPVGAGVYFVRVRGEEDFSRAFVVLR